MCCPRGLLLVEDDDELRTVLEEDLASVCGRGAVVVARDGAQALAIVRQGFRPCCILTDLNMPRMDGPELVRALGAEGFGGIPVVTMSGARGAAPPASAAHLEKPFEAEALRVALLSAAGAPCRFQRR